MSHKTRYSLSSAAMVNTPGLFLWLLNVYKTPKDRQVAIRALTDGYSLPRAVAVGLLSGAIPYTVRKGKWGGSVVFTVDTTEPGGKTPAARRPSRVRRDEVR